MTVVKSFITLVPTHVRGIGQGVHYLWGDNLTVVWAEFSTLSGTVLLHINISAHCIRAAISRVENSAQGLSC